MTEDTESVGERLLFFSADGCHQLRRLLRIVAMSANRLADERDEEEERREAEEEEEEEETRCLREEVTTSAGCLLYRLCEMVKYCSAAEEGVDLRKLLRLLSDQPDAPCFYEATLRQLFRRIVQGRNASTSTTALSTSTSTSTKVAPMTPTEAIAFFQRFSVLNFTLQHNAVLSEFIRNNFSEEFRYYIEPKKIRAMIPSRYPVHSAAVALVQRVANAVFRSAT